jgi:hypothetical protein
VSEPGASPLARDRPESPFARILAGFVQVHSGVLSATFVDAEGECIDYASRIEPYEAQLIGAQLSALSAELATRLGALHSGPLVLWVLEAARREFVVRRVTDEHLVVIALAPQGLSARLLRATTALAEALRREGGLSLPAWDPGGEAFEVQIRPSPGWGYAPCALQIGGAESRALEVLGRWTERGSISAEDVVCFRVRAADHELTLAHDRSLDRWYRR